MPDLPDLFPGFQSHWIDTPAGKLFARSGGSGPPLVLVHGYPQSGAMWHRVAPTLARTHTVVVPDLRGYGQSAIPASTGGDGYSKRIMAGDIVALMAALGHDAFSIAGHDRGGRVSYRLALDHPDRVTKVALLDIVPSAVMWDGMNAARALQVYHWTFFAQPAPLPETLIGADPTFFLEWSLSSWTARKSLDAFAPGALAHYRAAFSDPARVHATCEDYRAGATLDRAHDVLDCEEGRKIEAPLLVIWGGSGIPARGSSPLDIWRAWAADVRGHAIDCGHFLPEEAPDETAAALAQFFA